ncbi:MAG TPA: ABC-F family ATP-binding cassette domain-containing protein [Aggregatilineales bacterium]|nr:ABC-F family ATP-binding cassette domain-containing protein [Aggregatilineales bacterium]
MHILQIDHLTVNHAGREIFRDLNWAIGDHDRVGLVGPNGAGKSSLLKAIVGDVIPDSGLVARGRGIRIGYLSQEVQLTSERTLIEEASQLPPELAEVEAALARLEAQFADPDVYGDPVALARTLARQETVLADYERLEGARHSNRVREYLIRLGFTPAGFDLPAETLSGGQKKLVRLVQLALEQPDILLLDEPDNHLDLTAKRQLEEFIAAYDGGVILVSHDRYLLDGTVTQIAELANGRLTLYKGNYTAYTTQRELERLRQQQLYTAQQKEIARIEAAIARFEHWASIVVDERHIRQARSRRKMLDRMEANGEIVERVREARAMDLRLDGWRGSTRLLELRDLTMGFDDDVLFLDVNLTLRHGERVGLIGPNGAGKSVLFRLILGELQPLEGAIKIGPSVRIGYYSQEHQTLAAWLHRTPIERIRDMKPLTEGEAVALLGKFLFRYEQTRQPIGTLSGGERSRLQLACVMLSQPNLLLLDEPTNNLDIPSVEALESALEDFDGAILTISHDRYFLDQTVDRVLALDDGSLAVYEGGYTDYLAATGKT